MRTVECKCTILHTCKMVLISFLNTKLVACVHQHRLGQEYERIIVVNFLVLY